MPHGHQHIPRGYFTLFMLVLTQVVEEWPRVEQMIAPGARLAHTYR